MPTNYIFHSASYDRELFRKEEICLNDNGIDYQADIKESQAQAPLADYFEAEIRVSEKDFKKAERLLKDLFEKFS